MEQEDNGIISNGGDQVPKSAAIDIPVSGGGEGGILLPSVVSRILVGSNGSEVSLPTYLILPDDATRSVRPIALTSPLAGADEAEPESTVSRCHVKRITWFKKDVAIILQNENGPCPLIAITNVMLLRRHLVLEPTTLVISTDKLVELIAECVVEAKPREIHGENFQELVQASLESLSGLSHGLNVDVKFSGVTEFENTRELAIFKVLNIPLYHGWVRYNEPETLRVVGNLSYNQLTEKMFADRYSGDDKRVSEAFATENFLKLSASQLTYEGLSQLVDIMKFAEVSVLFRNNHFSTLVKYHTASPMDKPVADSSILHLTRAELYILVTDQGFLNEPNIVWETLTNVENDSTFVDSDFIIPKRKDMPMNPIMSAADKQRQEENDAYLARQLQEQEDGIGANPRMIMSAITAFDPLTASSSSACEPKPGESSPRGQMVACCSKSLTPPGVDKLVGPVAPLGDLMVGLPPEGPVDARTSRSADSFRSATDSLRSVADSYRSATDDLDSPRAGGSRSRKTDKSVGKELEQQAQAEEVSGWARQCVIL